MELINKLKFTLEKDKRLISDDGELLKNKITELALKFDKDLSDILRPLKVFCLAKNPRFARRTAS